MEVSDKTESLTLTDDVRRGAPGTYERNIKVRRNFIRRSQTTNWKRRRKASQEPTGYYLFIFATENLNRQNHGSQDEARQTESHWKNLNTDDSNRSAPANIHDATCGLQTVQRCNETSHNSKNGQLQIWAFKEGHKHPSHSISTLLAYPNRIWRRNIPGDRRRV